MIKNQRQYRITKSQIAKLEAGLEELATRGRCDTRLKNMEADALKSQIEELREEIQQYERLTTGEQQAIHFESFQDLPQALVQARIAAGLTQKELAERLGLQEQQIQRYEATQYASASLSRLTDIMDSLGVNLAGDVTCVG